jgi:L-iditol 2-dehydrogenase
MLAAVLHGIGDLRVEQVATPEPGEGEALVRVRACGVCASDVARVFGSAAYRVPLILGHEFAGEVARLGPGAHGLEPGMRCAVYPLIACGRCDSCRAGRPNLCDAYDYLGSRRDGAFAECVAAPAENCIPLPENVSFAAAALTEPCAVALHAVRRARVRLGGWVAVFGAGPIGIVIGRLCRLAGARVMMLDIDERKLAAAREFGLEPAIVGGSEATVQQARDLTGGAGVAVAFEAAGAPSAFRDAIAVAAKRGTVALVGNIDGEVAVSQDDYSSLLRRELRIIGNWNSTPGGLGQDDWRVVLELMASGALPAERLISHRLPLARAPEALALMRSPELRHRVLLEMD